MKKVLIFLATILFFNLLSAQEFHIGLHANPGLSWIKTKSDSVTNQGLRLGFAYGLMADIKFADNYALSTGVNIVHNGGSVETEQMEKDTLYRFNGNYNIQYVELPITLKLMTNEIGYTTYYGQFGITPGLNISAKKKGTLLPTVINDTSTVQLSKMDVDDQRALGDIALFNLSLTLGAGIHYSLGDNTAMVIGAYFNNGFTNVFAETALKSSINTVYLRLGIIF